MGNKKWADLTEAEKEKRRKRGREWARKNRPKARASGKEWRFKNPEAFERHWRAARLRKYGLTAESYAAMLEAQGGLCAICRRENIGKYAKSKKHPFQIDHCHTTGKTRALLCQRCNLGLGCFRDNPELMELAAAYIRSFTDE